MGRNGLKQSIMGWHVIDVMSQIQIFQFCDEDAVVLYVCIIN